MSFRLALAVIAAWLFGLSTVPVTAQTEPPLEMQIQQFLAERECYLGSVDGQWGSKSRRALNQYLRFAGLKLHSEKFDFYTLQTLRRSAAKCSDAEKVIPYPSKVLQDPDLTIGQDWQAALETSERFDRVAVETDPARIRSGKKSIRLHLFSGDCGGNREPRTTDYNDCTSPTKWGGEPNERVSIITEKQLPLNRAYWYGASMFLDETSFKRQPKQDDKHWLRVNLYQWIQSVGPSFNIVWFSNEPTSLTMDNRTAGCDACDETIVAENALNRWIDVVTHVRWTTKKDGFLVMWIDGKKVYEHRGPTIRPDNTDRAIGQQAQLYRYSGVGKNFPELKIWFDQLIGAEKLSALEGSFEITDEMRSAASDGSGS